MRELVFGNVVPLEKIVVKGDDGIFQNTKIQLGFGNGTFH